MVYVLGQTTLRDLTYQYDTAGRRTQLGGTLARTGLPQPLVSATYNGSNQLTAWGSLFLAYDALGNLLSDGLTSYNWNPRNQLQSITGELNATFAYDAVGRRVTQSVDISSQSYLYDRFDVVQELSGAIPAANLITGTTEDERFVRTAGSSAQSFVQDGLGSTLALADSSGAFGTSYTYAPFGATIRTGASSSNPFQYTGRERLGDRTDLYYYRARFYSAAYQRFLSEDPIEFAGGVNLYAYVHGDPINFIDPLGTCECIVEAKCRSVNDWRANIVNAQHCYFVVQDRNQLKWTLTGGQDRLRPGLLGAWATQWSNGVDPTEGNSPADKTYYRSVGPGQTCTDVDCLMQKTVEYHGMGLSYRLLGPNSNTFVSWAARQCGLGVVLPGDAFGRGRNIP